MKKTISINLQGIIFYIEDDGYEVLSRYLYEVKAHFASYQGHEEIVADIEGRIAELFAARVSATKQVITLTDVEEMTAKMGRVSDFNTSPDDDEEEAYAASASTGSPTGPAPATDGQPRRLYRDLAHRKIAGVCAGLAQYFMVNPLVVRLVFLACLLLPSLFRGFDNFGERFHRFDFGGLAVFTYIVLWIVLPKRTDAPAPIDTLDLGGPLRGRKLFRDTDTGKVGGVASGLAAYFQTDVVLVRVLFLVGLFAGGSTLIIYLILWAVVPEARSVSEKMQMRGDAVTLSGIDSNLRTGALDADGTTTTGSRPVGAFLESAARGARPAVSFLGTLIRWVVAAWLIFVGGSWLFSVIVLLGSALSIIPFSAVEHTSNGFMFGDQGFGSVVRNIQPWGAVAGALLTGIPALMLILLGLRLILHRSVLSRTVGLSLLGLWLLGLAGSAAAGVQIAREFQTKGTYTNTVHLNPVSGRSIVLDSRNLEDNFEWVSLKLAPADSGAAPFVEQEFRANGRTQDAARLTARESVNYTIDQQDSTILFDQGLTLKESAPFRNQKLTLTLHLPLNKTYRLTSLFLEHLRDNDFTNGQRPDTDQAHRARFTREGKFTCLDCPASNNDNGDDEDDHNADHDNDSDNDEVVNLGVNGTKMQVRVNTDGDQPDIRVTTETAKFSTDPGHYGSGRKAITSPGSFNEVEAHGAFRVVVRHGNDFKVEAAGRSQDLDEVRLTISGDRLVVRHRDGSLLSGFDFGNHPILISVTLPRLQHLELSGACQADVSGFRDEDLRLEASGASTARLDVNVPTLKLDLNGACRADLVGSANELSIDGSGTCQVEALKLRADKVTLDLNGVSQAKVQANQELNADLSGSSTARYTGRPSNIRKDISGNSSLEALRD